MKEEIKKQIKISASEFCAPSSANHSIEIRTAWAEYLYSSDEKFRKFVDNMFALVIMQEPVNQAKL